MAAKTLATYISELSAVTSLGAGDKIPVLESSTVKYVEGNGLGVPTYARYVALLTQSGTDAPVATVLENTLGGTVVWSYSSDGIYIATLSGAFTENKTWFQSPNVDTETANALSGQFGWIDVNSVKLVFDTELLGGASVEIRVYP